MSNCVRCNKGPCKGCDDSDGMVAITCILSVVAVIAAFVVKSYEQNKREQIDRTATVKAEKMVDDQIRSGTR